tara:strand:+ start:867 stop:1448 length:582 start_codon:yes stop_codon:yes gene_type:complete
MKVSSITVDDFYSDVDEVRQFALQQSFDVEGNYPGRRTKSFLNDSMKEVIQTILLPHAGEVVWWGGEYSGAYQYTTKHDKSWIHADHTSNWAGVVYLTPNAPPSGGTGFFKHKEMGLTEAAYKEDGSYDDGVMSQVYKDSQDYDKWEMIDQVSNKYNRLIMYRGNMFHQSLDYFGDTMYNGRLFQTFFFNTEI